MRNLHPTLAALALLPALAAAATAQVRITEVLVDPLGANPGWQLVELQNETNRTYDLTGHHVAAANSVQGLPPIALPAYQILRIHVATPGSSTPADIFLPNLPPLARADTFALLRGSDPNDPQNVVDFVAWGGGRNGIFAAVAAGQWPSTLVDVPLPAIEGASIAHFGSAAFGSQDAPDAWYGDRTPTLGLANDPGSIFNRGIGCTGPYPVTPWVGLARPESRPWIGERFELDVFNLPSSVSQVGLVIGMRTQGPVRLDPLGLTHCALLISVDFTTTASVFNGSGVWSALIPADPGLVGGRFYAQALVPWPGAPNPAGALVTNAVVCGIGSR